MQMTDDTFEWAQRRAGRTEMLSADQLYDPEVSIRYGGIRPVSDAGEVL